MTSTSNLEGMFWLCPLYSFNCDSENVDLEEGISIRRIPNQFISYLDKHYSHMLKTIPSDAKWVALLPYIANTNGVINRTEIFSIIYQEHERATNLLVDLMTTLRLYQKGRIVAGLLTSAEYENSEWHIGGDTIWTPVSSMDFFQEEPIYKLRHSDIGRVNDLLHSILNWRTINILNELKITLDRFHSAYHGQIEDRIIDQMIAFESLYLGNEQELTYRLISRATFLLRKRKDHRIIVFNNIKKAYNYRSGIVHGSNPPSRDAIGHIIHKTEDYLRQSIVRFLYLLSVGYSLENLRQGTSGNLAKLDENILSNGRLLV